MWMIKTQLHRWMYLVRIRNLDTHTHTHISISLSLSLSLSLPPSLSLLSLSLTLSPPLSHSLSLSLPSLSLSLSLSLSHISLSPSPLSRFLADTCLFKWLQLAGIPASTSRVYEETLRSGRADEHSLNCTLSNPHLASVIFGGNLDHANALSNCFGRLSFTTISLQNSSFFLSRLQCSIPRLDERILEEQLNTTIRLFSWTLLKDTKRFRQYEMFMHG